MIASTTGSDFHFDRSVLERRTTLDRKLELFGDGSRPHGLHGIGTNQALHDRALSEFDLAPTGAMRAQVRKNSFDLAHRAPERFGVARIMGRLEGPAGANSPQALAIAIRGTIRATVPVVAIDGQPGFSAMLPESALPKTIEEVQILAIRGTEDTPILEPLLTGF
jgi:hypothetical protein